MALPHGVVGWSAVCDCGISRTLLIVLLFTCLSSDFCYLLKIFANSFGPISGSNLFNILIGFLKESFVKIDLEKKVSRRKQ